MAFSKAHSKPSEDISFEIGHNENLKPSILSTMDYYHGANLRTPGIEYPEGYVHPQPAPEFAGAQVIPEEIVETAPSFKAYDNGLGIMVVDYPETEPSAPDNLDEAEFIPEFVSERSLYKTPVSYKKLATSGLGKIVKAAKSAGSSVADKYYGANIVMTNVVNGIHSVGEKLSKPESKTNRGKVMKGLGGLALLGVVSYATYRGISLLETNHTHQAAHEAAQQILPVRPPNHAAEVMQHHPKTASPVHQVKQLAGAGANKASVAKGKIDEITVKPGEGITQTIRDYYPGKSASQYADAYNKLSTKVGASHIIEGIRKYKMSDGSLGLSHAGKARWGAHVHSFLQNYFKQPK